MPDISRRAKTFIGDKIRNERNNRDKTPATSSLTNRTVFGGDMALLINFADGGYDVIGFQFVPSVLNVSREVNLQPIQIVARNTPRYQYMGGSQSYSFSLDFHAETSERRDILSTVKYLESLSYSNANLEDTPIIQVIWGDIFNNQQTFKISGINYSMSEFGGTSDETEDLPLYNPRQATVNLTLVRVSETNLTWEDVRSQ